MDNFNVIKEYKVTRYELLRELTTKVNIAIASY